MRTTSRTAVSITLTSQQLDLLAECLSALRGILVAFAPDEIDELVNVRIAVRAAQAYLKGTV